MAGSSLGSSAKVLAKQPSSVETTSPPGNSPMKSSWSAWEAFCLVKVVVVLPVPDGPTISMGLGPSLVGLARHGEVGRVDDGDLRLVRLVVVNRVVVEEAVQPGEVRVRLLDDQAGGGPEGPVVADEPVDHDHVLVTDVLVLDLGDPAALLPADGLAAVPLGGVGHDVGRGGGAGQDLRLDVDVAVARLARLRHGVGEGPQLGLAGVQRDRHGDEVKVR